ncbi:hypothetical protein [Alkalibacter mobilis]|uniref:hypothetical protein n=1 Tax=Alkalibacter mobilis TaxID=2787712 RepID=UPI0018A1217C|nr:hypothetical protein [Alkalibacter mobilis]MBF7097473.1 hypothetical protein [Alkalibacter mobilis]
MAGWNLSQGYYQKDYLTEDEIWTTLNSILSSKSHKTTSYKYCFLKSLLDNIFNVNEELILDFDKIFMKFTEVYWNLVAKHKLSQIQSNSNMKRSRVEIIIDSFINRYNFEGDFSFEGLNNTLQLELIKKLGQSAVNML